TGVDDLQVAPFVADEDDVVRGARLAARHVGRVPLDDERAVRRLRVAFVLPGEGLRHAGGLDVDGGLRPRHRAGGAAGAGGEERGDGGDNGEEGGNGHRCTPGTTVHT